MMRILAEFPAYKLIEPTRPWYEDGDIIALPVESDRYGPLYSFFTFGSVAGYAIRTGCCPEAEIARCRKNMVEDKWGGHKLWWLNQNATVIHSGTYTQETRPLHQWGDMVRFHGRYFKIEPAPNGNAALKLYEGK
jgi:hypothetical protein